MAMHTYIFDAIGTKWQIDIPIAFTDKKQLLHNILARIEMYDNTYSRFRSDSTVTKMSKRAGNFEMPSDSIELFEIYEKLGNLTDGQMTPLIGNTLIEAGYDANYSFITGPISNVPSDNEIFTFQDRIVHMRQPWMLDFGAAGKGHLVDIIADLIMVTGIDTYIVDAGGDMRIAKATAMPVQVGLEHPLDASQALGMVEISSGSICGSATTRRSWSRMHHIFNPKTLSPVQDIIATWVLAQKAILADALATALFFVNPEVLLAEYDFEYCIVRKNMQYNASAFFENGMFTDGIA